MKIFWCLITVYYIFKVTQFILFIINFYDFYQKILSCIYTLLFHWTPHIRRSQGKLCSRRIWRSRMWNRLLRTRDYIGIRSYQYYWNIERYSHTRVALIDTRWCRCKRFEHRYSILENLGCKYIWRNRCLRRKRCFPDTVIGLPHKDRNL